MNKHAGWISLPGPSHSYLFFHANAIFETCLPKAGTHLPVSQSDAFRIPLPQHSPCTSLLLTFHVGMSRQRGLKSIELTAYYKHGRLRPLPSAFDWWHMRHHALNICKITGICSGGKHSKCIINHSSLKAQWGPARISNTPPTKADLLTYCSCVGWSSHSGYHCIKAWKEATFA